ncbi:MAG: hypothetical protein ACYCYP_12135 [Leptospirales bacterium]
MSLGHRSGKWEQGLLDSILSRPFVSGADHGHQANDHTMNSSSAPSTVVHGMDRITIKAGG